MASARLSTLCRRPGLPAACYTLPRVAHASYHSHHNQRVRRLHASPPEQQNQLSLPSPAPSWAETAPSTSSWATPSTSSWAETAPSASSWDETPSTAKSWAETAPSTAAAVAAASAAISAVRDPSTQNPLSERPLGKLSLTSLLRSIMLQEVMSRPAIVDFGSSMLRSNMQTFLANPLFRIALEKMFYSQFCAGRTKREISETVDGLKELGYRGVILMYAREVDMSAEKAEKTESSALHREHVAQWLTGNLKTIEYVGQGDCVAVKYTGAGAACVRDLESGAAPDAAMADALEQICQAAKEKGAKLLFDAEHHSQQGGIDSWTMSLMEKYNRDGQLVVYNTYQMYLKESTANLASHLALARSRNFALGAKLVRGAYINSDPRHLIHDTKADTDKAFDDAARMLATLHVTDAGAPKVGMVLASHNKESTDMVRDLRREQMRMGQPLGDVDYAQLMGMADELSLGLTTQEDHEAPARVFKYVVWGSTEECVLYLLRRAEENRDAVERSSLSRQALWEELRHRLSWKPEAPVTSNV